jgi:hypothetical protein
VLQSIAVTADSSSITASSTSTLQFIATGTYSDGSTKPITNDVTWDSSSKNFATIDAKGLATAVAAGKTIISATLGGIIGKTDLTVTALVLKANGLQITPANPTLSLITGTLQLTLTATFTDNTSQTVTTSSSWTISPASSIATIGATTGVVTANSTGTGPVTVFASFGGQSVSTIVTITQ